MSEIKSKNNLFEDKFINNNNKNDINNIKTVKLNHNKNNDDNNPNNNNDINLKKSSGEKKLSSKENISNKEKKTQSFIDKILKRASKDKIKIELNKILSDSQSLSFYLQPSDDYALCRWLFPLIRHRFCRKLQYSIFYYTRIFYLPVSFFISIFI